MSNVIITKGGLSQVLSASDFGPFCWVKYFIPVYDPRIDPNQHNNINTNVSAYSNVATSAYAFSATEPYGQKIYNTSGSNYSLSTTQNYIISAGANTSNQPVISNYQQSKVNYINLYNGVPLENVISGSNFTFSGTGNSNTLTVANYGTIVGDNTPYTSARDKYFPVVGYTPTLSSDGAGVNQLLGTFHVRLTSEDKGTYKFNKFALYAIQTISGSEDLSVEPTFFAECALKNGEAIIKGSNVVDSYNEIECDVQINISDVSADWNNVFFSTSGDYFLASPGGVSYPEQVKIGRVTGQVINPATLQVGRPGSQALSAIPQLRINDSLYKYSDFEVTSAGVLNISPTGSKVYTSATMWMGNSTSGISVDDAQIFKNIVVAGELNDTKLREFDVTKTKSSLLVYTYDDYNNDIYLAAGLEFAHTHNHQDLIGQLSGTNPKTSALNNDRELRLFGKGGIKAHGPLILDTFRDNSEMSPYNNGMILTRKNALYIGATSASYDDINDYLYYFFPGESTTKIILNADTISLYGNLLPIANNYYDIGSNSQKVKTVYTTNLSATNIYGFGTWTSGTISATDLAYSWSDIVNSTNKECFFVSTLYDYATCLVDSSKTWTITPTITNNLKVNYNYTKINKLVNLDLLINMGDIITLCPYNIVGSSNCIPQALLINLTGLSSIKFKINNSLIMNTWMYNSDGTYYKHIATGTIIHQAGTFYPHILLECNAFLVTNLTTNYIMIVNGNFDAKPYNGIVTYQNGLVNGYYHINMTYETD